MKLLEAIAAKAIEVREVQQLYFSLRKGNGRYPSTEARQVLKESKIKEAELDELLERIKTMNTDGLKCPQCEKDFFIESLDGSKVCYSCRTVVIKNILNQKKPWE